MKLAFVNNEFIAEERAVLGINDLAIRRGFGIFDFFRTVGLQPLFIDEHLSRFYTSVEKVGLGIPVARDELKEVCIDLVRKNNMPDSGLRIILTGGYSSDGYTPTTPNLIVTNEPIKLVDEATRAKGVKVITHNYQREFPEVKTINYFTGVMMQNKANSVGAYDILYHDHGQVREFTRSNIFALTGDDKLITPKDKLLMGVTRRKVIDLAKKKFTVEEGPLTMEELLNAKEIFITGTTKRVLPVVQVDDHIIGDGKPGKITMDIFDDFYQLEQMQI
jgi:branched-chain amino acid aminotransferase